MKLPTERAELPVSRSRTELSAAFPLAALVFARVRAAGHDPAELIRFLPVSASAAPWPSLPLATFHRLLELAERLTGDAHFGLHLADELCPGYFGLVGYLVRNAPTLRAAAVRLGRYATLFDELATVTFQESAGEASLEVRLAGTPPELGRHGSECALAFMLRQARLGAGRPIVPVRVWLAHQTPDDRAALAAALGTHDIELGAGASGFSLAAADWDLPLAHAEQPLFEILERVAEQQLELRSDASRLVARIRQAVAESGPGRLSIRHVAASARLAPRTLQARLADEGTSFKDLVDGMRKDLALSQVADLDQTLDSVSFRLGYAHLEAFLRAFKRWTGMTPTEYRLKLRRNGHGEAARPA